MLQLYNFSIRIYYALIFFASVFGNSKAKLWIDGRKYIFAKLKSAINTSEEIIWFHVASLGEFEQALPLIEEVKSQFKNCKILLTFFSPSGFEIKKNYRGADYIFYLPLDTKSNARKFVEIVNPKFVIFVKYEFWYHYLNCLKNRKIPTYVVSAIFRKNQRFFKWYAGFFKKTLNSFNHIFVQNEISKNLLSSININQVSIAGDTRFDRVAKISEQSKKITLVEKFKQNSQIIIGGSSWQKEEEILINFINQAETESKFIIAPHEIKKENIDRIFNSIKPKTIKFSEAGPETINQFEVLIIDNIGMLSSLYKYCEIAFIGGGFGVGIHNILEAATFGLPVIFGPNYSKFQEANELIQLKGAFPISNFEEFNGTVKNLIADKSMLEKTSRISSAYVESKIGATKIIIDFLLNEN
ncbi:MAG: 3-deoxy-D-manno-octulosonic acid transferase [Bacteroidetes bacterium]|jgi:3-deoxy-D-manno-octulosonic-acid transferase|nr:3-deoxy-D-manno-octulosonic acid transferase [Bacteroidota bacterium]MBT6687966.1 3-deoxy-D-manno-octulosonic acid transferase [Bacteroidota bacterium]MBT7143305.1 3-deoxy-D-manno-octulosonic acid transferase [Bacteroidota bacterium]MBT7490286.1 3-deoxy-D-manno-octulosonic acid transferase [Bacteroidota bacterium]